MPENETLVSDARMANRWQPIAKRLDCGLPPIDAFPEIEDRFYFDGSANLAATVRHQMQKSQLVRDHFDLLVRNGLVRRGNLRPFQAGAFIRNKSIERDFGIRFRETTHRCRPFLFMSFAGLVANTFVSPQVEVFESGVGSVNLPLVTGPADYRTTRSTHPYFLRLMSRLISHVNDAAVRYVLPFADKTKAEMVVRLREMGLHELARRSISCILHPLRRQGWQQCGHCPACVYRRQAMLTAGIDEAENAYQVDLFADQLPGIIATKHMRTIQAFHQQIAHLPELDSSRAPECFGRYLRATKAASSDREVAAYVEVYRRYRNEWLALVADARRRHLPWIAPVHRRAA